MTMVSSATSVTSVLPRTVDTSKEYTGEKLTYIVDGAHVWCDKSEKKEGSLIELRPPDRGSKTGYANKVMDIDTDEEFFDPRTFGNCKDGSECVLTELNDPWDNKSKNLGYSEKINTPIGSLVNSIARALDGSGFNENSIFTITKESTLVCWKNGGVIQIEKNGQIGGGMADMLVDYPDGMTEEDIEKIKQQSEEYLKMHGQHPTMEDLHDLFFLTDMRLNGNGDMLLTDRIPTRAFSQMEMSNNLYELASTYPDYYKLGDKYGFGTSEYNAKLNELSSLTYFDFIDKKTMMIHDESFWKPYEILNDKICNALVEQAIYESKTRSTYIDTLSYEDFGKFTDSINSVVSMVSGKSHVGTEFYNPIFGGSKISKIVHYERNAFNRCPSTLSEMYGQPDKWELYGPEKSIYHMSGEGGEYNLKFVSKDGKYEAVYNKDGKLLTLNPKNSNEIYDAMNGATYNYGPVTNIFLGFDAHHRYDMEPYYEFGGDPNTPASAEATKNQEKFDNNPKALEYGNEQKELFLNPPIQDEYEKRYEG